MSSDTIRDFLSGGPFAVVGASTDRSKYGNKVLRSYMQSDLEAHPVHPREEEIEGLRAYPDLGSLPEVPHGITVVTPPSVTEAVVEEAAQVGVKHVWMQPGAESDEAIARAAELGLGVIAGGPCLLVVLGFREV